MDEKETILFGIPVPSDNKVFLTIVVIHILLGLICVLSGVSAMFSQKGGRTHIVSGKTYYWGLVFVFITVVPLTIMRWPLNNHLFILGTFALLTAHFGRRLAHNRRPGWTRLHTISMGASYIFLLTAFYVDNGKNLPFWRQFGQLFFWIFPAAIGIPVIVYALLRHPLNKRKA